MLQLLKDTDQPLRLDKYTMITSAQLKLPIIDVHIATRSHVQCNNLHISGTESICIQPALLSQSVQ
jgi:hypothetical protein